MSWCAARSSWEYCLRRADQGRDPVGGVLDLVHQLLGLQRVRHPVDPVGQQVLGGTVSATSSSQSVLTPAATRAGARSQPSSMPWSSSQSVELVLGLADLHRGQLLGLGHPLDRRLLQLGQADQGLRVDVGRGQVGQLAPHLADPLAQRGGGPDRRGGGVVQLVGQPGRQPAEREQPLPLRRRSPGWPACPGPAPRACAWPSGTTRGSGRRTRPASITQNVAVGDRPHRGRVGLAAGLRKAWVAPE